MHGMMLGLFTLQPKWWNRRGNVLGKSVGSFFQCLVLKGLQLPVLVCCFHSLAADELKHSNMA